MQPRTPLFIKTVLSVVNLPYETFHIKLYLDLPVFPNGVAMNMSNSTCWHHSPCPCLEFRGTTISKGSRPVAGRYRVLSSHAKGVSFAAGITAFAARELKLPYSIAVP
ncbi:hypothetical protein EGM87_12690 [Sphingobium sp. RSMS]|uniref:hypothetical protein n=1 Tax=Sphingobium sp. RSMS TaxID=520734 RepID=UPI0010F74F95|nr:hypothetical protein [Sphingobium sp. RSMS]UXC89908.1 hypothetical protein EGM87_12690 [Sphingobium sp. RSMS]